MSEDGGWLAFLWSGSKDAGFRPRGSSNPTRKPGAVGRGADSHSALAARGEGALPGRGRRWPLGGLPPPARRGRVSDPHGSRIRRADSPDSPFPLGDRALELQY